MSVTVLGIVDCT